MPHAYYKTSAAEVLAALAERNSKLEKMRDKGHAFAEHFGGELIVQNGVSGYRISGLKFTPPKPTRLWTAPDKQSLGQQRPRQSITRATPEEKAELASLKQEWKEHFPSGEVEFDPVLRAMGTSYGNLIFGGSFAMHQTDEVVYVATSAKLNERMTEIVASEYEAAKEKQEKVK